MEAKQITLGRRLAALAAALLFPGSGLVLLGRWYTGLAVIGIIALATLLIPLLQIFSLAIAFGFWLAQLIYTGLARAGERLADGRTLWVAGGVAVALVAVRQITIEYVAEAFKIPSGGMMPTLLIGDHLMVTKSATDPERGDLIVFDHPKQPDTTFIKRVAGLPGDRVEVRDGRLYVNGQHYERDDGAECTLTDIMPSGEELPMRTTCITERLGDHRYRIAREPGRTDRDFPAGDEPYLVPAGHVFVLGDNRDNSADSRFWGPVPLDNVTGTASFVWWSNDARRGVRWDRIGRSLD